MPALRSPTTRDWLLLSGTCVLVFVILLGVAETNFIRPQETGLRNVLFQVLPMSAIMGLQTGFIGASDRPYLSLGGMVLLFAGVVLVYLLIRRRIRLAILLLAVPAGAAGLANVLQSLIVRPGTWAAGGHTFPSGHAALWSGLLLTFACILSRTALPRAWTRGLAALLIALAALFSLSTLTFHDPVEMLGGYALAAAWWALLIGTAELIPRRDRYAGTPELQRIAAR